jgi:hypothetical protein
MDNQRIIAVEWARLQGHRPRKAGSNARLGEHGIALHVQILRITSEDGTRGFGACRAEPERIKRDQGRFPGRACINTVSYTVRSSYSRARSTRKPLWVASS